MRQTSRRKAGRPPSAGPEAEANPLSSLSLDERRELFLEVAARLFQRHGYLKTSVEDITEELGFTKKVFYYYWKNKQGILQEIHDRGLRVIHDQLNEIIAEDASVSDRLDKAVRQHVRIVMQDRSVMAVLLGEFKFSEETLRGREAYTRRFQDLVEEGISAGVVCDVDSKVLTFSILGLCNSVAQWYQSDGRLPAEEIENILAVFARSGWSAEPL